MAPSLFRGIVLGLVLLTNVEGFGFSTVVTNVVKGDVSLSGISEGDVIANKDVIAKGIASSLKVEPSDTTVTGIQNVPGGRRRLDDQIIVSYKVEVGSKEAADKLVDTIANVVPADLGQAIKDAATAEGVGIFDDVKVEAIGTAEASTEVEDDEDEDETTTTTTTTTATTTTTTGSTTTTTTTVPHVHAAFAISRDCADCADCDEIKTSDLPDPGDCCPATVSPGEPGCYQCQETFKYDFTSYNDFPTCVCLVSDKSGLEDYYEFRIEGTGGNDCIAVGGDFNYVFGLNGDDVLIQDGNSNILNGGNQNDLCGAPGGDPACHGEGTETCRIYSCENDVPTGPEGV